MKKLFYTIALSLGFVGLIAGGESQKTITVADLMKAFQTEQTTQEKPEVVETTDKNIVVATNQDGQEVVVSKSVFKKSVNWFVKHKGLTITVASAVVIAAILYLTRDMKYGVKDGGIRLLLNDAFKKIQDGTGFVWEKTKDGAVSAWEKTKDGAVSVWEKTADGAEWVKKQPRVAADFIVGQSKAGYNATKTFVRNHKVVTAISAVTLISVATIIWDILRDKDASFLKQGATNAKEIAFEIYRKIKNENGKSLLPDFLG